MKKARSSKQQHPQSMPRRQKITSMWHYYRALLFLLLLCTGLLIVEVLNTSQFLSSSSSSSMDHDTGSSITTTTPTLASNISLHGVHARAFEKWSEPEIPCYRPTKKKGHNNKKKGLLFLKLHKVGSSTAAGINARIALNEAERRRQRRITIPANGTTTASALPAIIDFEGSCEAQLAHAKAKKLCPNRDKSKSFLWSIVRDPTSRVVSRFFHTVVSLRKNEPKDTAAINFFCSQGDHYMERLSTVPIVSTNDDDGNGDDDNDIISSNSKFAGEEDRVKYANKIMADYDFIGVTERMDESAVALSMLLNISLGDVLYLNGKASGGYGLGNCMYFVPSFQSPAMQEYFQTNEFQECTKWDRILHQAANRSLDLTIDQTLGRAEFEAKLSKFRSALVYANKYCDDSRVVFSCTAGGVNNYKKENDCLYKDSGCGYKCLDEVAKKLNL